MSTTIQPRAMPDTGKKFKLVIVDWTSDAAGAATEVLSGLYGWLIKAVTVPGTSGDQPTDNYDITLVDEFAADAAQGLLANRDNVASESVYPCASGAAVPVFLCGESLTVTVANAGNTKTGRLILMLTDCL